MTGAYLYCLVHMNHNPQQWTTVQKCGPQSTNVDYSPQPPLYTSIILNVLALSTHCIKI